jgi:methyltransferase (TIGR00027 family)
VRFFELDHPDTLAVKRRALEAHDALPPLLALLPVDLVGDSGDRALAAAGYRPGARSCFVAEGLLPFLPPEAVDGVFAAVRRQAGPGSRFVFTLVDAAQLADETSDIARIAKFCALWNEPIRSSHDRGGLEAYLAARGFRRRMEADSPELRRRYLEPIGLPRTVGVREFLVVAEVE